MALFSKKSQNEASNQPPRNPSNTVMFRVLAIGYVVYLCIQMVQTYTAGGPDAPSLGMLIGGLVLLGGGAIVLAVLAYKEWKVAKPAYDKAMAELREQAKAAREAEEAALIAEVDAELEAEAAATLTEEVDS